MPATLTFTRPLTGDQYRDALTLLNALIARHNVAPLAAPTVHALARALDGPCALGTMGVLCTLAARLGATYLVFEPTVRQAMRRQPTPLRGPEVRLYEHLLFCLMEFVDEAEALAALGMPRHQHMPGFDPHRVRLHGSGGRAGLLALCLTTNTPSRVAEKVAERCCW